MVVSALRPRNVAVPRPVTIADIDSVGHSLAGRYPPSANAPILQNNPRADHRLGSTLRRNYLRESRSNFESPDDGGAAATDSGR